MAWAVAASQQMAALGSRSSRGRPAAGVAFSPQSRSSLRYTVRRNAHPARQSLDLTSTGLASISGSQSFTASAQVLRHLAPRPLVEEQSNATALFIRAGLIDVIKGLLTLVWNTVVKGPAVIFAKLFQKNVDQATDIVKEGAEVISRIARSVNTVADAVEDYADQVASIADKVIETTDTIDDEVEDVVEVLQKADDIEELAAGISEETGISLDAIAKLKQKSATTQEQIQKLKSGPKGPSTPT